MKVLMVEPGKSPYAAEIESGLKSLQDFPKKNGCRGFCPFTLRSGGSWQRIFGVP